MLNGSLIYRSKVSHALNICNSFNGILKGFVEEWMLTIKTRAFETFDNIKKCSLGVGIVFEKICRILLYISGWSQVKRFLK